MITRDRLLELGLALVIFLVAALALILPTTVVGALALALAVAQIARAQLADDWAIVDLTFGVLLLLLGGTTIVTPAWGIPLLYVAAAVQLVRALDDVGMAINLALLASFASLRGTPDWAVAILVMVAVGKVLWLVREHVRTGSVTESPAT